MKTPAYGLRIASSHRRHRSSEGARLVWHAAVFETYAKGAPRSETGRCRDPTSASRVGPRSRRRRPPTVPETGSVASDLLMLQRRNSSVYRRVCGIASSFSRACVYFLGRLNGIGCWQRLGQRFWNALPSAELTELFLRHHPSQNCGLPFDALGELECDDCALPEINVRGLCGTGEHQRCDS